MRTSKPVCTSAEAQDGLLTEQVGLGLLGEGGLDAARPQAADALGVRERDVPGLARGVLLDSHQHRNPATVDELTTDQVAGALRGDHEDVDALGRRDVAEADVEAVTEDEGVAGGQVRFDGLGVHVPLDLVRGEDDDDVGFLDRLGDREDAQALCLGLGLGLRTLGESDAHIDAGIAE
jgi:hypothetical protein